jgi:hypothetical protein
MNRKSKAKWFFIGLAAGWVPIIIAAIVILAWVNRAERDDPFHGVRPDMGEDLHEFGRPATWNATHMQLGSTGFKAAAGPHRYTDKPDLDWDHYAIDIEKPDGKSSYVYFERNFRMDEIPRDLIEKTVRDIVTFDEESRVVTFDLGTRIETYKLPNR